MEGTDITIVEAIGGAIGDRYHGFHDTVITIVEAIGGIVGGIVGAPIPQFPGHKYNGFYGTNTTVSRAQIPRFPWH